MWGSKRVSVVLMTYAERGSIRGVIDGFLDTGVVDEVLVVDNNAEPGTAEEVAKTRARSVHEPRQGYGHAMHRGLREADGDLLVVSEPDGTFLPSDVFKLLVYSGECDAVFGTRTTEELIWSGANMAGGLRWGNWAVAKLIMVLFNTASLTDVGCTMRLVSGPAARGLLRHYTLKNNAFSPEMILLSIIGGWRVVQIPVNFRTRQGKAGTTDEFGKAFGIGLQMIRLVLGYRARSRAVARRLREDGVRDDSLWRGDDARPGGEPTHMFPALRRLPTRIARKSTTRGRR
jgi:glycosyltransferase involved in cell wall biosynthesis